MQCNDRYILSVKVFGKFYNTFPLSWYRIVFKITTVSTDSKAFSKLSIAKQRDFLYFFFYNLVHCLDAVYGWKSSLQPCFSLGWFESNVLEILLVITLRTVCKHLIASWCTDSFWGLLVLYFDITRLWLRFQLFGTLHILRHLLKRFASAILPTPLIRSMLILFSKEVFVFSYSWMSV